MLISLFSVIASSFLLSALLLLVLRKTAPNWNFLGGKSIPPIGGIGMGLAFMATLFLFFLTAMAGLPREIKGIFFASSVMLISGIRDDQRELSVPQKFLVQLLAAFILVAFGVRTEFFYVGEVFNVVLSVFWIVGITNAINLLDVTDGLAGVASLIIVSGFCAISLLNGDILTLVVSLALGGAVLGFLIYNLPPAKIYMGNSGSHFLGLVLAAIALTGRYATLERPAALLTPVVLLGFPILDTAFLIFMRIRKGKSAFNKSNDHMALRFFKKGYSKRKTLALMTALNFFFVICGVLLSQVSNLFAVLMLGFVGLISIVLTKKMGSVEI